MVLSDYMNDFCLRPFLPVSLLAISPLSFLSSFHNTCISTSANNPQVHALCPRSHDRPLLARSRKGSQELTSLEISFRGIGDYVM